MATISRILSFAFLKYWSANSLVRLIPDFAHTMDWLLDLEGIMVDSIVDGPDHFITWISTGFPKYPVLFPSLWWVGWHLGVSFISTFWGSWVNPLGMAFFSFSLVAFLFLRHNCPCSRRLRVSALSLPTPSQGVGVLYPFSALPTPPVAASVCPPTDIASGGTSPQGNAPLPQVVPISVSCRQLPASQVLDSYTYFF